VSTEYFVYIMTGRCGTFYTGITNHLVRRVLEHRTGRCGFTSKYNLTRLVYFASTTDVHEAIAFEKRLKRWTREKKKLELIRRDNPRLLDLGETALGMPSLLSPRSSPSAEGRSSGVSAP
jgi:putative endonuclease